MFSHIMLGADDVEASKKFYDAALGEPIDGNPTTHANGSTYGFTAASPEAADAFHKAGVAAGGTAVEDAPGWREGAGTRLYLAYLRDPSGNKICAMCREA